MNIVRDTVGRSSHPRFPGVGQLGGQLRQNWANQVDYGAEWARIFQRPIGGNDNACKLEMVRVEGG